MYLDGIHYSPTPKRLLLQLGQRFDDTVKAGTACFQLFAIIANGVRIVNRAAVLELLSKNSDELRNQFGIKRLALFGSAARNELREDSDIDVLVEFEGPATFDGYFDLKTCLEQLLGRQVDLVTEKGLKPRARRHVEKDLIRVA